MNRLWKRIVSLWALTCVLELLVPATAHAQLSLLFSPPDVSGTVGSPIMMQAELMNLGAQSVNWDSLSVSGDPSLTISNISPNFEAGTLAGGHTLSGMIFDVTPTQAGFFDGTVTLSSGANAIVSGNFQVTAQSATPPPPTLVFTLVGGVGAILRFRPYARKRGVKGSS